MVLKFIPFVLIIFLITSYTPLFSQNSVRKCHTVEADARLRAKFPEMGTLNEFEQWLAPKLRAYQKEDGARAISTIPVIFHIIHDGEAVGNGDNLNALYINAQIQQLNNDFRRVLGTTGYNDNPVGADSEIEFCAALSDPSGNPLTEVGINRIDRNTLGWSAPPYGECIDDDFDDTYIENTIKPQSQWDPNQYFNIWVMDIDCAILGYAQFPSASGLSGLGNNSGAAVTDGVVLLSTSIGSTDTPFPAGAPYNKGRTATHEVGHFFGLRHIWGDQECGNDYCADTPQAEGPASGCTSTTTCDGNPDMVENYMDYSSDDCMNIFTTNQKARMQTVLLNSPRRGALANSTACTSSGGGTLPCTATISTFPYSEGFEDNFGSWIQSTSDNFDWLRKSGPTPSGDTGPTSAATGDWYLFIESSSPNYSDKVSILSSPCFDLSAASNANFEFQYHLYGATNMGGLALEAKTAVGSWSSIWSAAGNQGNAWQTTSVNLSTYTGATLQLRFVGTTGSTWQGDMAIDNLNLTTGTSNPSTGCVDGITSFPYTESWESNFGAWSQAATDDFDWIRNTGETPSGSTGPGAAIDGIWYAYVESSDPNYANLSAVLNGPCYDLSAATEATFTFQYHLFGATNMGSLTLEAKPEDGNWTNIWSRSGDQGDLWKGATVGLNSYVGGSVELRFVGTTGTTWQGDMAIDDLALTIDGGGSIGGTCTDISLAITFDNYPEETSWEITDASGTIIANGGPYTTQADGSTINLTGCFVDGCYNFIMKDAYGDGMCCTYGNGSYSLTDASGNVLASGASYGGTETTNFCLPTNTRQTNEVSRGKIRTSLNVFPNPVRDQLNINYESKVATQVNWRIVDLLGRQLQSSSWQIDAGKNNKILRVDQLPAGTYLLVIEHNGQPHTQRFVVSQ